MGMVDLKPKTLQKFVLHLQFTGKVILDWLQDLVLPLGRQFGQESAAE